MTTAPTAEQIAVAELNGWDPNELAANNARVERIHKLMRKHSKYQLLQQAFRLGLADANNPAGWTKLEIAAEVVHLEQAKADA